jgi:hypothetical protein
VLKGPQTSAALGHREPAAMVLSMPWVGENDQRRRGTLSLEYSLRQIWSLLQRFRARTLRTHTFTLSAHLDADGRGQAGRRDRHVVRSEQSEQIALCSHAGPVEPPLLGLHVVDDWIENAEGEKVHLRGVNRSGTACECVQNRGIFAGPRDRASVRDRISQRVRSTAATPRAPTII